MAGIEVRVGEALGSSQVEGGERPADQCWGWGGGGFLRNEGTSPLGDLTRESIASYHTSPCL